MKSLIIRFVKNESGATAIEYGLIAAVMGVAIITAFTALGGSLGTAFGSISTKLTTQAAK
ncbi:MAG TPA: Flp family type IVb pilin [Kaistia sp.]|nr:Flp family type IVb pilin [Kaistia sp.]